MEKLSITGFKNFCAECEPATFTFDTENQPNGELQDAKIAQRFTRVVCMLHPSRIMFANEQGTFCLNRVKCVKVYKDVCPPGHLFSVICGNKDNSDEDTSYTFLADRKIFK